MLFEITAFAECDLRESACYVPSSCYQVTSCVIDSAAFHNVVPYHDVPHLVRLSQSFFYHFSPSPPFYERFCLRASST